MIQLLLNSFIGFITIFIWEYVCKRSGFTFKPSTIVTYVASILSTMFSWLGTMLAKISSFLTLLDFKEFIETFSDIYYSLVTLIDSPFHFIKGYFETAGIYDHPYLIIVGTITLTCFTSYALYYFELWYIITTPICYMWDKYSSLYPDKDIRTVATCLLLIAMVIVVFIYLLILSIDKEIVKKDVLDEVNEDDSEEESEVLGEEVISE
jgi:hypothetical protein